MKYLDQTVCEALRKWPPVPMTDRLCVKDYDLKLDGKNLHINANDSCYIPIWSFHRDLKYFPNPEKFEPERFSEENRGNIDPDTYLPFGVGPRNCIGSRFALMEMKTFFYYLLLNFSFEANSKTQIPLEFDNIPFDIKTKIGIWLSLKPRNN
ncbi:CLUMA_CG018994, isoform A [Clunio marinus]|uniref:CLUMA_CG018994, isoform A n=1 Tax=Clunio marinus TaxID=568069 RepID=A0A1J1J589_9DIPT|nr:CLUMA_CG018994, isoform A [Clunio marinus]